MDHPPRTTLALLAIGALVSAVAAMVYADTHLWFCVSDTTCTANAPGWPDHASRGWGWR